MSKPGPSYAEVGRKLGISRERVRQIAKGHTTRTTIKKKPDLTDPEAILTLTEAAELLNVHRNTLRRWSDKGMLKTYRIGSRGDRRFSRGDIDNLFQKSSDRTEELEPINHPHNYSSVDLPEFRDYARLKYSDALDEDLITMIEDLIERERRDKV